jgi:hypothetical protein
MKQISVLLSVILMTSFVFVVSGQEKGKDYLVTSIGFYNVENLFDTINTPGVRDSDFTPEGRNQWGTERYYEKLDRLGEVIELMATEKTPDGCAVLGLAEIENEEVIKDLVSTERLKSRDYKIVHYDSPDKRGIDVALIYQPKYFTVESSKTYTLKIPEKEEFYTRDQLLVSGDFLGERFHFIVAHWPSRRGGEKRSSPLREAAGDLARSIVDSIFTAEGDSANIIFMGDLNDDPVNNSVKKNMNTERRENKMKPDKLFNPFEDLYRKGIGTLAWRDVWNLFDQIMLTNNLVGRDDFSTFTFYKAVVFNKPFLRQSSGRFEGYPYRSYAGGQYLGGYSDHFPVYIFLLREIK